MSHNDFIYIKWRTNMSVNDESIKELVREGMPVYSQNQTDVLEKTKETFRVASWNIYSGFNKDYPLSGRKSAYFSAIDALKPEILNIQGASTSQAKDFIKKYEENYHIIDFAVNTGNSLNVKGKEKIGDDEYVGEILITLVDKKKFDINNCDIKWLSATPDEPSKHSDASRPRAIVLLSVTNKDNGNTICIANSHYDHRGPESLQKFGEIEVELIANFMQKHECSDYISCGNRNCYIDRNFDGNKWYNNYQIKESGKDHKALNRYDFRDASIHYGLSTTFIGYENDPYKAKIFDDKFEQKIIDVHFSSLQPEKYLNSACEYELDSKGRSKLLPMFGEFKNPKLRQTASNHTVQAADLKQKQRIK